MKFFKTILFSLIILSPHFVLAVGLVKCDGSSGKKCNFAALITLISDIINWAITIAPMLAALTFGYAGFLYMSSSVSPSKKEEAHKIFNTTLLGLVVVAAAWLIIKMILVTLGVGDNFNLLS